MYNTSFHKNDLNKVSFLVTGGAGFIGSNIVEYLLKYKAKHVRVIDNFITGHHKNIEPFYNNAAFKLIEGDICEINDCNKACENIDYILHQAALGSVPRSMENPAKTNSINIDGFLNILIAAKDKKVKRIVYASSSSVYGDDSTLPKVENKIGNLYTGYSQRKTPGREDYCRWAGQIIR